MNLSGTGISLNDFDDEPENSNDDSKGKDNDLIGDMQFVRFYAFCLLMFQTLFCLSNDALIFLLVFFQKFLKIIGRQFAYYNCTKSTSYSCFSLSNDWSKI